MSIASRRISSQETNPKKFCWQCWHVVTFWPKNPVLDVRSSHPAPDLVAPDIKAQLQGCHVFSRNGHRGIAHVENVSVEPEGLGAWRYAREQGLIPDQGYTVVIDIGGGTWRSRLFNPSGDIIDQSVDERGGGYDLATSISFDSRPRARLSSRTWRNHGRFRQWQSLLC